MKIIKIGKGKERMLKTVAECIRKGGLVVLPSDTVYGLFVDATNQKAVDKLIGFKNRWQGKAISVAVANKEMAKKYVVWSKTAEKVVENLLPGPFTIVCQGKHRLAKGVEAANGTLGIRIPDNQLINEIVKTINRPITATSANLSGRAPHYSVDSLLSSLSQKKKTMIDLIIDGGKLPINLPSTVVDATESEIRVLRRGELMAGGTETLISDSERETGKIAIFLLKKAIKKYKAKNKPITFVLTGDLGGGKTVFAKAVGKELGVKGIITSPTFTIMNEYEMRNDLVKGKFIHFDLYRIKSEVELEEIAFWKQFDKENVVCIEWPENMGEEALKKLKKATSLIRVQFEYVGQTKRKISYQF